MSIGCKKIGSSALLALMVFIATNAMAESYFCTLALRVDENCKVLSPDPENDPFNTCLRDDVESCLKGKLKKLSEDLNECNSGGFEALDLCEAELEKSRKKLRKLKQQQK